MELTEDELNERIAVLKHFRSLLEQQRAKFKEYLEVLEKQETPITTENTDTIIAHTELEQQVVKNIANLQKVIVPMTKIYDKISTGSQAETDIENIRKELTVLQNKVLVQNEKNRELLRCHITEIRTKINNFQNPYKKNPASVYASQITTGRLIEVEA